MSKVYFRTNKESKGCVLDQQMWNGDVGPDICKR